MDNKILMEEITRINELTNSKTTLTENTNNYIPAPKWLLTETIKKAFTVIDDVFKVGKTAGKATITIKAAGKIVLPGTWKVLKI